MNEEDISIEKCLNVIPNKFDLTVCAIGRAKELFSGIESVVEDTKFAKKHINKALLEIEENKIDVAELRERIRNNILNSDNFIKDMKQDDDLDSKKDSVIDGGLDGLDDSLDEDDIDSGDIGDGEDLGDDVDIDKI